MAPAFAAVMRLSHRTRQVLLIAFDYHMRADLVTDATQTMTFEVLGSIWHTDQGKQYGAHQTRLLLLHKGFVLSMSRAGTPTDNGDAERFVGAFNLAVADRRPYHTPGSFYGLRRPGSTFTIWSDHMRGWITSLHFNMFSNMGWRIFLHSPSGDVYFTAAGRRIEPKSSSLSPLGHGKIEKTFMELFGPVVAPLS